MPARPPAPDWRNLRRSTRAIIPSRNVYGLTEPWRDARFIFKVWEAGALHLLQRERSDRAAIRVKGCRLKRELDPLTPTLPGGEREFTCAGGSRRRPKY